MEIFISKTKKAEVIDFDSLPAIAKDHIINYGLRQLLNDSLSDCKVTDFDDTAGFLEHCQNRIDGKIENLKAGVIRANGGGRTLDPIERKMLEILVAHITTTKRMKKKDAIAAAKQVDMDSIKGLRDKATTLVEAERASIGSLDINLDI